MKNDTGYRVPRSINLSPRHDPEVDATFRAKHAARRSRDERPRVAENNDEEYRDYNSVAISEFTRNPIHYLKGTSIYPLAIRKYGRVLGVYCSIQHFNELLGRIRSDRAYIDRLRQLLDAANPQLLDRLNERPGIERHVPAHLLPRWPILKSMPAREPIRQYSERWLQAAQAQAAAEALEEMERVAGNYRLPDPDSDDDWGRWAYIADARATVDEVEDADLGHEKVLDW